MARPIILIDGFSLVFRAYHAMSRTGMQTPTGEPTFAVFAFANILAGILDKQQPENIAVAFDTSAPTFRHEEYDQYKANRDAFPEDLVPQLARIKTLIDALGIRRLEMPGYEADDVIGTLARRESEAGNTVLCVTSDKDYFQLVNDKVNILRPGKDPGTYDKYDAAKVLEKFGVGPEHVIDVLALMGDAVDNVPGVKGIGEKTAIPLIQKHGSLENLYDNLESIDKASVKKKLEESRDLAFLSKKLVTIHTEVPVDVNHADLQRSEIQFEHVDALCQELGFTTLRHRFRQLAAAQGVQLPESDFLERSAALGNRTLVDDAESAEPTETSAALDTVHTVAHDYTLVDTEGGLTAMLAELGTPQWLSVDLETTGLDAMQCAIVGIALCAVEGKSFYIDVDDRSDSTGDTLFETHADRHGLPVADVIRLLKPLLTNPHIGKVGQNLKYDSLVLRRYDVVLEPIAFDTMLASYILNADMPHNLDALAERWMNYKPISITTLIGEKKGAQRSMRDVDPSVVAEYAAEDADVALKLANILKPRLEDQGLMNLATSIEFPTEETLVHIEHTGVFIDKGALASLGDYMRDESTRLEKEIYAEAGESFTINSPKQLGEVLFDKMMLPGKKKTKTGYSTDVSVLTELADKYPIAQLVLDYRQVEKLRSTYVDALPRLINPRTGRVHTSFNQTVAATGRLSSTDPNLQNIPVRTELGQQIRKAFVPQHPDSVILSADYSQIELRIMAAVSQDENLIQAFHQGEDVHKATAAVLFDVPIAEVTTEQRRIAKTTNFGIMYGQGAFGLAQRLGISRHEGQAIIDNYFGKYGGIKRFIEETIATTRDRGYTETLCGRRRYFPLINSNNKALQAGAERACINTPIQGTAADMMKLAMINVHRRMQRENSPALMMLQVHDELLFEVRTADLEALRLLVTEEMQNALPLKNVPVLVETGFGSSWFEAH
ncbi:MAG: DNA polymerase I [Bradyrhizobiaceae bacterium]|nr:DNA polymerase I [Bradyrhizobiaceae bacterium]